MALIEQEIYFYQDAKANGWKVKVGDSFYQLNNEAKSVLAALTNNNDYQNAALQYNNATQSLLDADEFKILASNVVELISEDTTVTGKKKKSFLALEFVLLKRSVTNKIAPVLKIFFQPVFFWVSFTLLLAISIGFLTTQKLSADFHFSTLAFFILVGIFIFIHELGHLAACKRFAGEVGEMGAGVYIIFPILYSNISPIWKSPVKEKVITNLAGVYMQLWCLALFYCIYLLTNSSLFYFFAVAMPFPVLAQLYPFIRSDGYWLLSDITHTPNLLQRSKEELINFIKNPIRFIKGSVKYKDIFCLLYGLANYAIVIYFVYYELAHNLDNILQAPKMLWDVVVSLFSFKKASFHFDTHIISTIIFYILAYKYLKSFILFIFKKYISGATNDVTS